TQLPNYPITNYNLLMFRYRLIRILVNILRLILLARIEVLGREHIPGERPYIVVLNHNSTVDTPVLLLTFPLQKWRFFAIEKWRHHPIYGPIMGWLGAIYVPRDDIDRRKLREALEAIEEGTVFGLAPEGTRSRTGQMMAGKDGAAYLAARTGAPILPVGLENTDVLFANFKRLRSTRLKVHIGEPFTLPEIGRRVRAKDLLACTHYIMIHIAAQLPPSYRGVYADSPALQALLAGEDPWPFCEKVLE
ncbi:MAG TPA: 1-acyl-sn-glycerol-3-phosphate acyltransferase, partial [Anaerolineae bacterium]|nr:1-acyl-sn-glycerol-3-phosphate acyltransferase [Anaerolineae bacterium]